jgi:DNA-binding MurR/RpiR family transcriptional regulator
MDAAFPVIAMTGQRIVPVEALARVAFELGDDSRRPFRSLVGPLCLAQALVVSTGHHLTGGADRHRPRARH